MLADAIRLMLFPALMAFAASSDLLTMTISNRVSLILIGRLLRAGLRHRHEPGGHHVAYRRRRAWCWSWPLCFFARGWIGGGDAKLAAATALWLGFDHLMAYLVYASLFGGLLTLVLLQVRTMPLPSLLAGQQWAERLHRKDSGVPYGIALAAAALVVYPDTIWMRAIAG